MNHQSAMVLLLDSTVPLVMVSLADVVGPGREVTLVVEPEAVGVLDKVDIQAALVEAVEDLVKEDTLVVEPVEEEASVKVVTPVDRADSAQGAIPAVDSVVVEVLVKEDIPVELGEAVEDSVKEATPVVHSEGKEALVRVVTLEDKQDSVKEGILEADPVVVEDLAREVTPAVVASEDVVDSAKEDTPVVLLADTLAR